MLRPKQLLTPLFILSILTISCNNKKPLIKKDESNENEKNNTLFVFVGEKIEVKELSPDTNAILMDGKFYAKYKILQRVYGNYNKDIIEFTAYDHYGEPGFSNYKNALLFVSKHNEKYFHEKYQYYGVFKTKEGRWAGAYSVKDFGYDGSRNSSVKPQKIDFVEAVSFPLSLVDKEEIYCWFPEPFYKIVGDSAFAVYGNYIEDLFRIKKEGVLTARGLFGNGNGKIEVIDTQMAEVLGETPKEKFSFSLFLKSFIKSIEKLEIKKHNVFTFDTIIINDSFSTAGKLIEGKIIDSNMISSLKDNLKLNYAKRSMSDSVTAVLFSKNNIIQRKQKYYCWNMEIIKRTEKSIQTIVELHFIQTNKGYKLYSCNQYYKSICWQ